MFNKRKLHGVSFNYRVSTTKERKFRTTCRALIGLVNSLKKYKQTNIGFDLSINVLNDHKPIVSCSAEKDNLSPKKNLCTNAIDQFKKKSHYLHERKKVFQ